MKKIPSEAFTTLTNDIEDEILEAYAKITDNDEDFYLKLMKRFFKVLNIPKCFTIDIMECIDYYYSIKGTLYSRDNYKQKITLQLIMSLTITTTINHNDDIIDIVDVEKLMTFTNKLIKYRDHYALIKDYWLLVVEASPTFDGSNLLSFKLTLPDLKHIKQSLNLDDGRQSLNDVLLIDMLSCGKADNDGNISNFDFTKASQGLFINIKDFACILGNLGELD